MLKELGLMCEDMDFDEICARELLQQVDANQEFVDAHHGFKTVLLDWAGTFANVRMAKLLLEYGADPNLIYYNGSENILWNLQYADWDSPDENRRKLEIVKLLLESGADPHLELKGEDLYFHAVHCHIELDEGEQWDYREAFIDLLEDYGA